jgi:hypothetical protein
MLASKVVFGPRLRGTEHRARSARGAQAYRDESEVWVPRSSTINRSLDIRSFTTMTHQAALNHSSVSLAPTDAPMLVKIPLENEAARPAQ